MRVQKTKKLKEIPQKTHWRNKEWVRWDKTRQTRSRKKTKEENG